MMKSKKNKNLAQSFYNAAKGFLRALKAERNLRIDIVAAVLAAIFSYAYDLSREGCAVVAVVICAVIGAELFNTSAERLADAITEEYNEHIRAAKDVASAAVFVTAAGAVISGIVLFLTDTEKLITALINIAFSPRALTAVILTLILGTIFILKYKERKS